MTGAILEEKKDLQMKTNWAKKVDEMQWNIAEVSLTVLNKR